MTCFLRNIFFIVKDINKEDVVKKILLISGVICELSAMYNLPMLGRYGEGYPMRQLCAVDVSYKDAVVPAVLQNSIGGRRNVMFSVMFFGSYIEMVDEKKPDNVIAHPFLSRWWEQSDEYKKLKVKTKYFNKNTSMGLFDVSGVVSVGGGSGISVGELGSINVNFHSSGDGVDAYSPNNGLISYDRSKAFAKFWLIIVSPFDAQNVFVGLVFVSLNPEMDRQFEEICMAKNRLDRAQEIAAIKETLDPLFIKRLETDFFAAVVAGDFSRALDIYTSLSKFSRDIVDIGMFREILNVNGVPIL